MGNREKTIKKASEIADNFRGKYCTLDLCVKMATLPYPPSQSPKCRASKPCILVAARMKASNPLFCCFKFTTEAFNIT